jgi:medium-chain acyl-[acyl-carrier-protein] hydrolase
MIESDAVHKAIRARGDAATRVRLFCLPYAGGGASMFREWPAALPTAIDVCPVRLPGREDRMAERSHTSLAALIDEVADAVGPFADRPFALFGHSMGALVAFELARELRRRGAAPRWLFVSGCRAPHRQTSSGLSGLPDERFVDGLNQKYGGIPDAILNEPELLEFFLPIVRADLSLVDGYRHREEQPLDCPISGFGGAADPNVGHDDLVAWREHTAARFEYEVLPGGHFFVRDSSAALRRRIEERLRPWM